MQTNSFVRSGVKHHQADDLVTGVSDSEQLIGQCKPQEGDPAGNISPIYDTSEPLYSQAAFVNSNLRDALLGSGDVIKCGSPVSFLISQFSNRYPLLPSWLNTSSSNQGMGAPG